MMQPDSTDKEKAFDLVECYAGAEYPERPRSFEWDGERKHIAQIKTQWRTPTGRIFLVITTTQETFELSYDQETDLWTIKPL